MGACLRNRGAVVQRGTSALGCALGAARGLPLVVLTERQAAPVADSGGGPWRSWWPPLAGAGGALRVWAWDPRHGLTPWPRALAVDAGAGAGVLRHAWPALRPGASQAGDARRRSWRHVWPGPGSHVASTLQQPWRLCHRRDPPRHRFRRGRGADHQRAGDRTSHGQPAGCRTAVERVGAALTAVPQVRLRKGAAPGPPAACCACPQGHCPGLGRWPAGPARRSCPGRRAGALPRP